MDNENKDELKKLEPNTTPSNSNPNQPVLLDLASFNGITDKPKESGDTYIPPTPLNQSSFVPQDIQDEMSEQEKSMMDSLKEVKPVIPEQEIKIEPGKPLPLPEREWVERPRKDVNTNIVDKSHELNKGPKKKKKNLYALIITILILICSSVVGFVYLKDRIFFEEDYKEPINKYCEGLNKLDYEIFLESVPEQLRDTEKVKAFKSEIEKDIKKLERDDATREVICKIKKATRLEKSTVETYKEKYKEHNLELEEAYEVKVAVNKITSYRSSGEEDQIEKNFDFIIAKIDSKWYVIIT